MKICLVFPKDSEAIFDSASQNTFGGATVQMYSLAEELVANSEHEVFCVVPKLTNSPTEEEHKKWNLRKIFDRKKTSFRTAIDFHNVIKHEKPSVLIQHGLTIFSCFLAVYCKLYKIKFIFMFASDQEILGRYQVTSKKCWLFSLLIKYSEVLVTQNIYQQRILRKRYGVQGELLYIGFPVTEHSSGTQDIVLWVGRCDQVKRPEIFIELAKNIPDQKFVMLCPAKDLGYFLKTKTAAEQVLNLEFKDFVPFKETWKYFQRAKIFVNTSVYEGFPQTFVQSVSCGVPIVSLDVNPDGFISKYQCGAICDGSEHILLSTVQRFLADKELLQSARQNAYKYAAKDHLGSISISKLISKLSYDK